MRIMTCREIAARIDVHLKRFEADQEINIERRCEGLTTKKYYKPSAYPAGQYVAVSYSSYQGVSSLSKLEALAYLAWLDAGNVGKHWEVKK
jgi:hypothetical protein